MLCVAVPCWTVREVGLLLTCNSLEYRGEYLLLAIAVELLRKVIYWTSKQSVVCRHLLRFPTRILQEAILDKTLQITRDLLRRSVRDVHSILTGCQQNDEGGAGENGRDAMVGGANGLSHDYLR